MSVHALSWVFRYSEATLGSRLVLLVLADHAKDDGTAAWPSVGTIASEARMTRRAVQASLRKLEAEGMVESTGVSRAGTTVYRVVGVGGVVTAGGVIDDQNTSRTTPEPSRNRPNGDTVVSPAGARNGNGNGSTKGEPLGFDDWLEHHAEVTGSRACCMPGSRARRLVARQFAAAVGEGRSVEELKRVSVGVFADGWRRERGLVNPEATLRPATIERYLSMPTSNGRRGGKGERTRRRVAAIIGERAADRLQRENRELYGRGS